MGGEPLACFERGELFARLARYVDRYMEIVSELVPDQEKMITLVEGEN